MFDHRCPAAQRGVYPRSLCRKSVHRKDSMPIEEGRGRGMREDFAKPGAPIALVVIIYKQLLLSNQLYTYHGP